MMGSLHDCKLSRRVLVTHNDGRQTVEEIQDDLGVAASDTREMMQRLQRQGVGAASISLFDGGDDGVNESPPVRKKNPTFQSNIRFG